MIPTPLCAGSRSGGATALFMSRKLQKGYFVRGQFVALGSAQDLELKRALKGDAEHSKTELKRESTALQQLGEDLRRLRPELLARLQLPEKLQDALTQANRIDSFEGLRRQLQFIGKLMRQLDQSSLQAVREALAEQHTPSALETLALHQAEQWRARLLAEPDAFERWLALAPQTDSQALRALIRQARKDATPDKPGAAARHGRAYREIFQTLKAALSAPASADAADIEPDPSTTTASHHG